ncbi:hypothetical protein DLAC_06690 [Tieghemostelium lacteum]|uniref:Ankyrin repeat-containing protein n=1 Tax=Tieghemostelium lacteum TaxID=361077 RepID=A0A151ZFE4_TIELA|nr:hypothetical protein DLAC_06690 [Tieghemostelium lacteum]|eukprot:KYQ92691.1 hypothetical protein DLAC_06690 [Tieghemostelium lacteum]
MDDSLFFKVLRNKVILNNIFSFVKDINLELLLNGDITKRGNKWNEIYEVDWMISNGHIGLFWEKFNIAKRMNDRYQLSFNLSSLILIFQTIKDIEQIKEIYDFIGDWIISRDEIFYGACDGGSVDIVKFLFERLPKTVRDSVLASKEPFIRSVKSGNRDLIKFIVENWSSVFTVTAVCVFELFKYGNDDLVNHPVEMDIEYLHYQCLFGKKKFIKELLFKIKDLETIMMIAIFNPSVTLKRKKYILSIIIDTGIGIDYSNLFINTIETGEIELFRQIFQQLTPNQIRLDEDGIMDKILEFNRIEMLEFLCENVPCFNRSPYSLGVFKEVNVEQCSLEMIEALHKHGQSINIRIRYVYRNNLDFDKSMLMWKYDREHFLNNLKTTIITNLKVLRCIYPHVKNEFNFTIARSLYSYPLVKEDIDFLFQNAGEKLKVNLDNIVIFIMFNARIDLLEYIWSNSEYLSTIRKLLNNESLIDYAIKSGHNPTFQFIRHYLGTQFKFNVYHLTLSLKYRNIEIVLFIHKQLESSKTSILNNVYTLIDMNDLPLVKYVTENYSFKVNYSFNSYLNFTIYQYLTDKERIN